MKKDFTYYNNLDYTIRLKENTDGTFFAEIEELIGCISEGDTKEEALQMVDDAKQAWIKAGLERHIQIPEPHADDFSGKLNVRLPKYVHRKLAYKAKREGVSLNTLISTTLSSVIK